MTQKTIMRVHLRNYRKGDAPMLYSNTPNVLIHLTADEYYVAISTYCRLHGRRGRFLISRDQMARLLDGSIAMLYDADCGNHLRAHVSDGVVCITFDWLSEYSDGTLKGFRQHVEIPTQSLSGLLRTGNPARVLYRPTDPHARVDISHAASTIRRVRQDGLASRALSKALRDCFRWQDETVTLYRDGPLDFLFTTASGCPEVGGLIRHETTVSTPVGTKPRVYYSVHT